MHVRPRLLRARLGVHVELTLVFAVAQRNVLIATPKIVKIISVYSFLSRFRVFFSPADPAAPSRDTRYCPEGSLVLYKKKKRKKPLATI